MKSFKLCSILIVIAIMMAVTACNKRVVTTPVVDPIPEVIIMEKTVVLPEPPVTVTKIRENVMFDYDSSVISTLEIVKIEKVKDLLNSYPDTVIILKGYASSEGGFEYNVKLSLARAVAVKAALVERDIAEDRIDIVGIGSTKLFGELLNLNRRVLILDVGK